MWNSLWLKISGTTLGATLLIVSALALSSCSGPTSSQENLSGSVGTDSAISQVALEVPTAWCSTCRPRVEASAKGVPGVRDVSFDKQRIQRVTITYDPTQTTPEAIVEAIETRGDKVTEVYRLR